MTRLRRTVGWLVAATLAATLVQPAGQAAGATTAGPAVPVVANAGIQARLQAATLVYEQGTAVTAKQPKSRIAEADGRIRAAVTQVNGDRVLAETVFDDDQKASRLLQQAAGEVSGTSATQLTAAAAALAEADRVAAWVEYESFLALRTTATTSGKDVQKQFLDKFTQLEDMVAKKDYPAASEKARQAWRVVEDALTDYWKVQDADHDGLPADKEQQAGTDPARADTDGDGLSDLVELLNTFTDPALAASNGTTRDDLADPDRDGLSNAAEQRAKTDPIEKDTDSDGLLDGFEVSTFRSDPLLADTDKDKLADDSESRLGTDPNDPDSDDDGILDGDEVYTSSTTKGSASLRITGVGDVAKSVVVTDESASPLYRGAAGLLSAPVDFSTRAAFSSAEVTFSFDPAAVPNGDLANVKVGFYDAAKGVLTPMPTTVDATGRATATTTHFTTFVLFYVPNWFTTFDGFVPGGTGGGTNVNFDVALILDSSGSMTSNDPQGLRRTASKSFIDGLLPGDQVAVVDFDSFASLFQPLTSDFTAAKAAVDRVNSSGGTDIGAGVRLAHSELLGVRGNSTHGRVEILLTDGEGAYDPALTQQAIDNNITVYTIGLGSSVDTALLQGIATATKGQYFPVRQAADLPQVFNRIGSNIGNADTDKDGLLDSWEITGMPTGSGRVVITDPNKADSDDDGLPDGDEIAIVRDLGVPYPSVYFAMTTDPTALDSDGDQMSDGEEVDRGSDPWRADEDGDTVLDGLEYTLGFDAKDANRDGDSFDDAAELANDTDPFTFDPTLADRTRALVAGALLGEIGYWLADKNVTTTVSIIYTPAPQLNVGFGSLDLCRIPFAPCVELVQFRPILTTLVEYPVGNIIGSFIPFADLVVTVRDTIGAALQGQFGWAVFELLAGAVGFVVPEIGDVPNMVVDAGKWINRVGGITKRLDEMVAAISKIKKFNDPVKIAFIKVLRPIDFPKISTHLDDADIVRILSRSNQSFSNLANVFKNADEVKPAGRWFDETAKRGTWGREAEDAVRADTTGVSKRIDTPTGQANDAGALDQFRVVDSLADDGITRVANEVKTGDGSLSGRDADRIRTQIRKDVWARDNGKVDEVVWHFFPSARSNRLGPDPDLLDLLKRSGIRVIIHTP